MTKKFEFRGMCAYSRPVLIVIAAMLFLALAVIARPGPARAESRVLAGKVVSLQGEAIAESTDGERSLSVGSEIYKQDVVVTGPGARVEILFTDDSTLKQAENSRIAIKEYSFNEAEGSGGFLMKIFTGALRFATGKIVKANPDSVKLETPLATIGIRGTDLYVVVDEAGTIVGVYSMEPGHSVTLDSGQQVVKIDVEGTFSNISPDGSISGLTDQEMDAIKKAVDQKLGQQGAGTPPGGPPPDDGPPPAPETKRERHNTRDGSPAM